MKHSLVIARDKRGAPLALGDQIAVRQPLVARAADLGTETEYSRHRGRIIAAIETPSGPALRYRDPDGGERAALLAWVRKRYGAQ